MSGIFYLERAEVYFFLLGLCNKWPIVKVFTPPGNV